MKNKKFQFRKLTLLLLAVTLIPLNGFVNMSVKADKAEIVWMSGQEGNKTQAYSRFDDIDGYTYESISVAASENSKQIRPISNGPHHTVYVANAAGNGINISYVDDGSNGLEAGNRNMVLEALVSYGNNRNVWNEMSSHSKPAELEVTSAYTYQMKFRLYDGCTKMYHRINFYYGTANTEHTNHENLFEFDTDGNVYYYPITGDYANGTGTVGSKVQICPFNYDTWYTVTVVISPVSVSELAVYDLYINGSMVLENMPLCNTAAGAGKVRQLPFTGIRGTTFSIPAGKSAWDDYTVFRTTSGSFSADAMLMTSDYTIDYDTCEISGIQPYEDVASLKGKISTSDSDASYKIYDGEEDVTSEDEMTVNSNMRVVVTAPNTVTFNTYHLNVDEAAMPEIESVSIEKRRLYRVGEKIVGSYVYDEECGVAQSENGCDYQWQRLSDTEPYEVTDVGTNSPEYTLTEDDLGCLIRLKVIPKSDIAPYRGIAEYSEAIGKISPRALASQIPEARNVTVDGVGYVGRTLTGDYDFYDINEDEEGATEFYWISADNPESGEFTEISGTKQQLQYTLKEKDLGKYIGFAVLPKKKDSYEKPLGELTYTFLNEPISGEPADEDIKYLIESNLGADSLNKVDDDLILLTKGKNGSAIEWESEDTSIIRTDGTVKRQSKNKTVILTATATSPDGAVIKQHSFEVTVLAKASGSSGGGGGSKKGSGAYSNVAQITTDFYNSIDTNPVQETPKHKFADVSDDYWAISHIQELYERGIVSGSEDNCFEPERSITREEFVKMIVEAFDLFDENAVVEFTDVNKNEWYYPYIASAYRKLVINGVGNNCFGIGQSITRQDMAVIAYKAAKASGIVFDDNAFADFADKSEIADYALKSVEAMQNAGVINGMPDGKFLPYDKTTRAEAAKVICVLLNISE